MGGNSRPDSGGGLRLFCQDENGFPPINQDLRGSGMLERMSDVASVCCQTSSSRAAETGTISIGRSAVASGTFHNRKHRLRPGVKMSYRVYAIRAGERIYIGQTQGLNERIAQHNAGHVFTTKKDRGWILVATEQMETRAKARWLERQLKRSRGRRERWIQQHAVV